MRAKTIDPDVLLVRRFVKEAGEDFCQWQVLRPAGASDQVLLIGDRYVGEKGYTTSGPIFLPATKNAVEKMLHRLTGEVKELIGESQDLRPR